MEKTEFVITDALVLEEFCNLKCAYCEGFFPTEFKFKTKEGRLSMPKSWQDKIKEDQSIADKLDHKPTVDSFFSIADEILQEINKQIKFPILKLSGGEIFLYDKMTEFIRKVHSNYNAIQLLTNATLFSEEEIEQFSEMGNVYFQISVDGHMLSSNYTRSHSSKTLDKILRNISAICSKNIGLEINCVLTSYNTNSFIDFVRYLDSIGDMTIFPRPVRGEPKTILSPTNEQISQLSDLRDQYNQYSRVLPPKAYFERVLSVLENKVRGWNCYVPFFVFGINNYGKVNTCTCSGELPILGSVFDDDKNAFKIISERKQYDPALKPIPCVDCITQYEIFNLYVEGAIDEKELEKIPTFKVEGALSAAQRIKKNLLR